MKQPLKILFIFFLLIFCIVTGFENNIVQGATDTVFENWDSTHEDYNVGSDSGTGTYGTWENRNSNGISNDLWGSDPPNSGSKSLKHYSVSGNNSMLWYNLTSDFEYIGETNISVYYNYADSSSSGAVIYFKFFLDDVIVINFRFFDDGVIPTWTWHDSEDNDNNVVTFTENTWYKHFLLITHLGNNNFQFRILNETFVTFAVYNDTCAITNNYLTFDRIMVYTLHAPSNVIYIYMDDINISTLAQAGDTYGDVSLFNSICTGEPDGYMNLGFTPQGGQPYQHFEYEYQTTLTCTIRALDLYISSSQYNGNNYLSQYGLVINGIPAGIPDYFIPNGNDYIIRWIDKSITLTEDKPLFAFRSTHAIGGSVFWTGLGHTYSGEMKRHISYSLYTDDVYNGLLTSLAPAFCFYYTTTTPADPCTDTDEIFTTPTDTGNIYYEYQNIFITGTVSTATGNYIRLYKDGVQYTGKGYGGNGKKINDCSFTTGFVADSKTYDGSWNCTIWNSAGGFMASHNFTIINGTGHYYDARIWTDPNPSTAGQSFTIAWLYNYSFHTYEGAVVRSKYPFFDGNNYEGIVRRGIYDDGQTLDNLDENRYYYLCRIVNNDLEPLTNVLHYVGGYYDDYIEVDKGEGGQYPLTTTRTDIPTAHIKITWTHAHPNSEVLIKGIHTNSSTVYTQGIGQQQSGTVEWALTKLGHYDLQLILVEDEGTHRILDSTYFVIIAKAKDTAFGEGLLPPLDPMIASFLAIVITFVFVMLPLLIAAGLKYKGSVPPLAYALSGALGMGLTVAWGWLDIAILYFIVVVGIIVTALLWIKKAVVS